MSLFSYLSEANVANAKALDSFVQSYVKRAPLPEGQKWFATKLRTYLFNNEELLTRITSPPPNAPEFVYKAIEAGQPVWNFDAAKAKQAIGQELEHIVDWFRSLDAAANKKPTNDLEAEDLALTKKAISKLNKIPYEQIHQAANEWFAHVGSRLKGLSKEGVEVLQRWPNGMYAVRYIDGGTMMRDGRDLQNCLQDGNYWDSVRSGSQAVYGIRKANDEAVVGIRVMSGNPPRLCECKGKNNQPVTPQYRPYVIDFLTQMPFVPNDCADLRNAGIYFHNGKYGSFRDIADKTELEGGVTVYASDSKFEVVSGDVSLSGSQNNHVIASLTTANGGSELARIMNVLGKHFKLTDSVVKTLVTHGVFSSDKGFGTAADIGTDVFHEGEVSAFAMVYNGQTILVIETPSRSTTVHTRDSKISAIEWGPLNDMGVDFAQFIDILNAAGVRGDPAFDKRTTYRYGFFYSSTQKKYVMIDDVGEVITQLNGLPLYKAPGMSLWMYGSDDDEWSYSAFYSTRGELGISTSDRDDVKIPLRYLIQHYEFKSMADPDLYGLAITKDRHLIGTVEQFLEDTKKLGKDAPFVSIFPGDLYQHHAFFDHICEGLSDKEGQELFARLYAALRPQREYLRTPSKSATDLRVGALALEERNVVTPDVFWRICDASYRFRYLMRAGGKHAIHDDISSDSEKVTEAVKHFSAQNPNVLLDYEDPSRSAPWWMEVDRICRTRKSELLDKAREAQSNISSTKDAPLSDRFKALNTLRKLER